MVGSVTLEVVTEEDANNTVEEAELDLIAVEPVELHPRGSLGSSDAMKVEEAQSCPVDVTRKGQ